MGIDNRTSAKADHQLPQTLLNANIELSQRMGKLLQDNHQRWSEFAAKAFGEGRGHMEKMLTSNRGQAQGQALNDLVQNLSQCAADNQALAQQALENQKAFMVGLAEVLQQWQQQSMGVMGSAGAAPWNNLFGDMLKQMNANFLQFNAKVNDQTENKGK